MTEIRIVRINGALAEARPMSQASLYELARVGEKGMLGEVIRLDGDTGTILIYEDTMGLHVGERVELTGRILTVQLGPGLLGSILDGLARPLDRLAMVEGGDFIQPGLMAVTLDPEKKWNFVALVEPGAKVTGGDIIGQVRERPTLQHKIMLPLDQSGVIADIKSGECTVEEPVGHLEDGTPLMLYQRWPVRVPRPSAERLHADRPFVTAQRVMDFLFPLAEGGNVATPGGFGTGKTVVQQSLARHAGADVVVFVGCGERGNEMADVLHEFPELIDPVTGGSIMDRTILAVNTSNMPMAAREASVYLGMTLGEYYRDMGYRVAVMCDSLSRWAEALREIGSRLQEMPGEEGYPTYLGNRLGKLYERAGRVVVKGSPERIGAVTLIGSFSPPGGDFSEPVTQAAMRVIGGLWALDANLAHQRQFPAINWETSYSLYTEATTPWFVEHVGSDWPDLRRDTLELLQREAEVLDIAGLVGPETLQDRDRLVLDAARIVREVVLGQNAYDPNDAASPLAKTYQLARLSQAVYKAAIKALDDGAKYEDLDLRLATSAMASARYAPEEEFEMRVKQVEETIAAIAVPGQAAREKVAV